PQYTCLQPVIMDRKVLINLRPEDELAIGPVKFSIGLMEERRIQVASSPVLKDGEPVDLFKEHNKQDGTSILVSRSMCESTPLAGPEGSLSTPKASAATQEKVLDTPALESRHLTPDKVTAERSEDSSLEDSLPTAATARRRKVTDALKRTASDQGNTTSARKRKTQSSEETMPIERPSKHSRSRNIPHNGLSEDPSQTVNVVQKGPRLAENSFYDGPTPRIVFSNSEVPEKPELMRFLRTVGAKRLNVVSETVSNFLCVAPGELKRTSKLTISVALGKTIVTDDWIVNSEQAGQLLDPKPYLPRDPIREQAWGFNLEEAIQRGREKVRALEGWSIYFTPSLSKELGEAIKELQHMAHAAGASSVQTRLPLIAAEKFTDTLLLGSEYDKDASELADLGWQLYSKDLLSLSILRGRLDTDSDEFKLNFQSTSQKAKGRVTRGR
ncbi:hypothetical protein GP486_005283, partial [Trichoglossum hirsutum]